MDSAPEGPRLTRRRPYNPSRNPDARIGTPSGGMSVATKKPAAKKPAAKKPAAKKPAAKKPAAKKPAAKKPAAKKK